jgi:hypothetical protein
VAAGPRHRRRQAWSGALDEGARSGTSSVARRPLTQGRVGSWAGEHARAARIAKWAFRRACGDRS